jgi:hypothetical protein
MFRNDTLLGEREQCQERTALKRETSHANGTQFGPAMYRMATGHAGLTPVDADAIVATAMRALAR